jgi:hypothetical protein
MLNEREEVNTHREKTCHSGKSCPLGHHIRRHRWRSGCPDVECNDGSRDTRIDDLETAATSDTSSRCTNKGGPAFGGSVFNGKHGGGRDSAHGYTTTSSHQQSKSWFEPPQDQKTALRENLQQARESWYQLLPQDQKDKLTAILDQLPQDEKSRIEANLEFNKDATGRRHKAYPFFRLPHSYRSFRIQ